jgi:hypothetical protein
METMVAHGDAQSREIAGIWCLRDIGHADCVPLAPGGSLLAKADAFREKPCCAVTAMASGWVRSWACAAELA